MQTARCAAPCDRPIADLRLRSARREEGWLEEAGGCTEGLPHKSQTCNFPSPWISTPIHHPPTLIIGTSEREPRGHPAEELAAQRSQMMMIFALARSLLLVASVGSACSYTILSVPGSGISGHRVAISMSETAPGLRLDAPPDAAALALLPLQLDCPDPPPNAAALALLPLQLTSTSLGRSRAVQRKSVQDSRIRMAVEAEAAHSSTQTTQSCTFFRTDQPPKDPSVSCWLADSGFREELDSLEYVCTKDPCIEMERDDHEDHTEDSY